MNPILHPSVLITPAPASPPWQHELRPASRPETRRSTEASPPPPALPSTPPAQHTSRPRVESIDLLRGAVMVIMTLDHVRDFFHAAGSMNPRDVNDPTLFLTRWITHFCAPVFILLAGVSASLYGSRAGRTRRDVSRFLLTRGVWLVVLELTLVNFGWTFDRHMEFVTFQVIWAIGCSMIALAGLLYLPRGAIAAIALVMIFGHDLFDGVHAEQLGRFGWVWMILHEPGVLGHVGKVTIFALYPLVPWVGVMAAGYALGPVLRLDGERRRETLINIGLTLGVLFIVLRGTDVYGDPADLVVHASPWATFLSLLNCEKYPPSLLYLAMTIGPAMILLALFDRPLRGELPRVLTTLGRVPFLFYVAHIYLIHLLAIGAAMMTRGGDVAWLYQGAPLMNKPAGFGFSLPIVYAIWLAVLVMLYPLCRWFAGVKQRRQAWWLSYL
jgi:uncharacterized membrane protein